MILSKEEKKLLLELICHKQNRMISEDYTNYDSDDYKKLEKIKVKIKNL